MTYGNNGPFDPNTAPMDDDRGRGPRVQGFPFPGVSGRTRGGAQYYVGGCCLPLPLGCLTVLAAGAFAAATGRWAGNRR